MSFIKKVKFTGQKLEQMLWGNHDNANEVLEVGKVYEEGGRCIHNSYTSIYLKGIEGAFNSVCFEEVK